MADYSSPSCVDVSMGSSSDKQCQSLDTRGFSKNVCCGTTTRLDNQNGVVQPLLTDLYQITMAYAYWKNGMCSNYAVFDLFFRKNPFHGEYTVFAGLEECLKFLKSFSYSHSDIEYLKSVFPSTVEQDFFTYLQKLTPKDVTVYAIPEGSVVFPKIPLLRVEGPLPVVQLLETTFLTLVNYASLVATNAARFRIAAGQHIKLLEYGLRRAQGPDGGLSASKYAYMGGFDGTSNVLAGKLYNIPVKGTHAHAFVMSFSSSEDCNMKTLNHRTTGETKNLMAICQKWLSELSQFLHILRDEASSGELAAFVSYATAFPDSFIALIDTYDVIKGGQWTVLLPDVTMQRIRSGLLNFCAVALGLDELGYRALGIRIDSGDLAYLSIIAKETFNKIAQRYDRPWFSSLAVVASNDINEETILSLNEQGHKIDCFGIGTHLVTCQKQPALGCVYKLVEVNKRPCIKLSLDVEKVTIPGRKNAFRLYGQDGHALMDLLQKVEEPAPDSGKRVLCRHPFQESKRAYVLPSKVEPLYKIYWDKGKICEPLPTLQEVREHVRQSLFHLRQDIKRSLNPTPYKVSVSDDLYHFMHNLWLENAPIGELS